MLVSKRNRHIFFLIVLAITGIGAYRVVESFTTVVVLAVMYSVIVRPMYRLLQSKLKHMAHLASIITIIISFFLILIPISFMINLFVQEAFTMAEAVSISANSNISVTAKVAQTVNLALSKIPLIKFQITSVEVQQFIVDIAQPISAFFVDRAIAIGSSSLHIITNFFIFLILIYFIIPDLPRIRRYLEKLSPLDNNIDKLYIDRAVGMFIATVKGTFLVAISEGLITGFLLWLAGIEYFLILSLGAMMLSIIPIVGPAFVTAPVGIFLLLTGNIPGALIVLVGQYVITSNVDNLIRAGYTAKHTSLHPAIMLVSILGGLSAFGVLGFIYGPIIMILFITSLEIYTEHYSV